MAIQQCSPWDDSPDAAPQIYCGLALAIPDPEIEGSARRCVLGGIIDLDGCLFGLTVGHPFDSTTSTRSSSLSTSWPGYSNQCPSRSLPVWVPKPSLEVEGSLTMSLRSCDWALVQLSSSFTLPAEDSSADPPPVSATNETQRVRRLGNLHNSDPSQLIEVLVGRNLTIKGKLRPNPAIYHIGTCYKLDVRLVLLKEKLPIGFEGSWVVKDDPVLGYIVAAHDDFYCMVPMADVVGGIWDTLSIKMGSFALTSEKERGLVADLRLRNTGASQEPQHPIKLPRAKLSKDYQSTS